MDAIRTELPLQLLGVFMPKGNVVHLYDLEGERLLTLCGRNIQINPRHIGLGNSSERCAPAESAGCSKCLRIAATYGD
jgi:hypothetical protein